MMVIFFREAERNQIKTKLKTITITIILVIIYAKIDFKQIQRWKIPLSDIQEGDNDKKIDFLTISKNRLPS